MGRQKNRAGVLPRPAVKPQLSRAIAIANLIEQRSILIAVLLTLIATIRIASTWTVFNHTADEPAHLACGMEWLASGTYRYEAQHPPLARIAVALGPWLSGMHPWNKKVMGQEGVAILYTAGGVYYDRTLLLARAGILPFFWLGTLVVFLWGRDLAGPLGAVLAVLVFTSLPPVLAHAGLATTDMALTATLMAALYTFLRWLDRPTVARAALFGCALAATVLSKFSSLAFLPAMVIAIAAWWLWRDRAAAQRAIAERWKPVLRTVLVALVVALPLIWACYRFSFAPVHPGGIHVPAPELFIGIGEVENHNAKGHPSYMLGEHSETGFWYYYPVDLVIKTPLGFLLAAIAGAWLALKYRDRAGIVVALCAGILIVGLFSRINIGIRHILPVYAGIALVCAWFFVRTFRGTNIWAKRVAVVALVWGVVSSAAAHPDYLPYFNEIVSTPENWVDDSDLDWGQDMKRVSRRLHELGAQSVAFSPSILAHLVLFHGFPPLTPNDPFRPSEGWNVVSPTSWHTFQLYGPTGTPDDQLWPAHVKPTERVGSELLYYFPPAASR